VPPDLAKRLKTGTAHVGDAFMTMLRRSEALRMNRVIGLGHRGQANEQVIDEIVRRYHDARIEALQPAAWPGATDEAGGALARGAPVCAQARLMLLVRDARIRWPHEKAGLRISPCLGRGSGDDRAHSCDLLRHAARSAGAGTWSPRPHAITSTTSRSTARRRSGWERLRSTATSHGWVVEPCSLVIAGVALIAR
jgi:hypothetical protein